MYFAYLDENDTLSYRYTKLHFHVICNSSLYLRIISVGVSYTIKLTPFLHAVPSTFTHNQSVAFSFTQILSKSNSSYFVIVIENQTKINFWKGCEKNKKKSIFFVLWLLKFHYKLLWTLEKALGNDRVTSRNCTLFVITCQHQLFALMRTFSEIKTKNVIIRCLSDLSS